MRRAVGPEDFAFEFSELVPELAALAALDFFFSSAAKNATLFRSFSSF